MFSAFSVPNWLMYTKWFMFFEDCMLLIDLIWFNESWNNENGEERFNWKDTIRDEINTIGVKQLLKL